MPLLPFTFLCLYASVLALPYTMLEKIGNIDFIRASIIKILAGEVYTGQVHTGQVHTGQVHTGQVHTGEVHTRKVHTGKVHTGEVHTEELYTGEVHWQIGAKVSLGDDPDMLRVQHLLAISGLATPL